ncbi:MAG: MFS transporter [Ferroplasma sp.]|uniref:MFS transporter n=1 Tax=Ferroplasma sp. TaxID=2591003 RepID=UPI002815A488|nr:MFS transporter [Ferroplasma sp.]WMT52107.1 MAG: MFS transporter [Ferroplasma sp.]
MEYDLENNRKIAQSIATSPWNGRHWLIFFTVSVSFLMWGVALSIAPLITTWYFVPAYAYYPIIGAAPAGLLTGNFVMGIISDKTGRKRSYLVTMFMTVAGLAGIGFSYNYIALIAFVFIAEFGLGGDETVSLSLMSEYFPSRYRGAAIVESSNMANIGITLMAGIFLLLSGSIFVQKTALVCIAMIGGSVSLLARYRMRALTANRNIYI